MSNTKKRIFFLIISLRAGGAERQISELHKNLAIEKIVCLEQGNVYNVPADKIITLSNHNHKISAVLKYLYMPIYLYKLYKAIKPNKDTIVISFLERANLLNAISKFFFKNICIQSIRTNYSNYSAQKKIPVVLRKTIIQSYKYADLIIGNSVGNTLDLVDNYKVNKSKVVVINNTYDTDNIIKFSKIPLDEEYEKLFLNHKTITFVSRFDDKKGHLHLIRILSSLKSENINFKLFFIGDGELKTRLIDLCHLMHLKVFDNTSTSRKIVDDEADVYFMGFQKNPYQFVSKSSIFAFPSILEGLPNALIEAIICNTFCISADCPSGPREIMTNNTLVKFAIEPELTEYGYLMPPFSGELLFNNSSLTSVEKLWKDILVQFFKKNIPKIDSSALINRFSKETIINQWNTVIYNNNSLN